MVLGLLLWLTAIVAQKAVSAFLSLTHLNCGQLGSALLSKDNLHQALLKFFGFPIGHRGKQETLKVVTRQAHQGAVDQPLRVLPAHKLQKGHRDRIRTTKVALMGFLRELWKSAVNLGHNSYL